MPDRDTEAAIRAAAQKLRITSKKPGRKRAKSGVRSREQQEQDTSRASAELRAKGREEQQAVYRASYDKMLWRYQNDREALLAEETWICAYCGEEQPPAVHVLEPRMHSNPKLGMIPGRVAVRRKSRCGCSGEAEDAVLDEQRHDQDREPFEVYEWLANMRRAGLIGWLAKATFDTYEAENYEQELQKTTARRYCTALLEGRLGDKPWLVLYGPYGLGKSHLAAAILHEAMCAGWKRCRFRVWPEWLEALQATFGQSGNKAAVLTDELKSGQVIVLDDLDAERPMKGALIEGEANDWSRQKLFVALNHRLNEGLPTILTFNHDPGEMVPWLGAGTVDRVIQAAWTALSFSGASYRSGMKEW